MKLDIPHLKDFWTRKITGSSAEDSTWVADNTLLSGLQLGLQETNFYLFSQRPELDQFEQWILDKNGGCVEPERIARINAAISGDLQGPPLEPVLTADDLAFWHEHGYVILHDAVPQDSCRTAAAAIYEFIGASPDNPDSWYRTKVGRDIWVPLLHHPAFVTNRNSPRIHAAYAQLWGRSDLWMNTDQSGFNPPERPRWPFGGQGLHWDVSLALPIPFGTQGILYLTDTPANQGAFRCVPGFHRKIETWLNGLPAGSDPRAQDFSTQAIPIAGRAGDLVIWHHALPHGASPNRGNHPRVVQYMNMRPSTWEHNPEWR